MIVQAAIYTRISSDVVGEGLGVARQQADCRALAKKLGWTVTGVYSDNDSSAFSGKPRPQYEQLLAEVERGAIQAVLAYAPDRLYRRLRDLAEFIEVIQHAGAQVQTVAGGEIDLNTASGRTAAGLFGVIAAGESDRMGERIRRKLKENAMQGLNHGGNRPYGWDDDRLTIRESEAAVIRECVDRVISSEPLRAIMRDLNERGIPTSTGKLWTHTNLLGVLKTARHAGLRSYHGKVIGQAAWPAIVPPETWKAMMRVLEDPSRRTTPGRGGKLHLLSVLAKCGICGASMCVTKGREYLGRRKSVYSCQKGRHVVRTQEHVDAYVTAIILGRLAKPDAAQLLHAPDDVPARQAALKDADKVRDRLNEAADMFSQGLIDAPQLKTITGKLRPRLAELEAAAAPPPERARAFGGLIGAKDVAAAWGAMGVDQRRLVISTLVAVTISPGGRGRVFHPDGIEVTWRQ